MYHAPSTSSTPRLGYYQIGGFGCSVNSLARHPGQHSWKTSKDLAQLVFGLDAASGTNGVDLIFGVKPCGAAYLLKICDERLRHQFPGRIYDARSFISLSDVHFADVGALQARLELLVNKNPGKRNQRQREEPRDRSTANKGFTTHGKDSVVSQDGKLRAFFEYQRLLVRTLRGNIDNASQQHYAILPPTWSKNIRIASFAYTLWNFDHRSKLARGDDLKIVDLGWTEYSQAQSLSVNATIHIKNQENAVLNNKNPAEFLYGKTELIPRNDVQARLRKLLFLDDSPTPLLLFVSNTEETNHVLRVLGVDISSWHYGVEPILGLKNLEVGVDLHEGPDRGFNMGRRSERSRSPRRGVKSEPEGLSRPRSPPRPLGSPHPVYVVDVADLYRLAIDEPAVKDNIRTMASRLGVETGDGIPLQRVTAGWCAGNESRLLGFIWYKLAMGNAIDEQKREYRTLASREEETPIVSNTADGVDSDSDVDPNDAPVAAAPLPSKSKDPYEALEDEDDDY